jgi:DNA-binding PadR family transcriptional regulator
MEMTMAREKFQTLTEQMYYILLALCEECCGIDVMQKVQVMTDGRVNIGPGTLYNLLEQFQTAGLIKETESIGRKKNYILTEKGFDILKEEYKRLHKQMMDYERFIRGRED